MILGMIQLDQFLKQKSINQNNLQNLLFQKDKVFNAIDETQNLSLWVRVVVETYDALLVIDRKRQQLLEDTLGVKQKALQEVVDMLAKLETEYNKEKQEKEDLEAKVNKCKILLSWKKKLLILRLFYKTIVGD